LATTTQRVTGERPQAGVTPDSLLALHTAGYQAVAERLGPGRVLDVGCGEGSESARLTGSERVVIAVDYSPAALEAATAHRAPGRLALARGDALALGLADGAFDWACSSHLIEHFGRPAGHVAELARVLAPGGTAFVLTPNRPADFENPFHRHLFDPEELRRLLEMYFGTVWVGGVDASERVKGVFAARRARASRVLALDVFGLRHRIPHRWYVSAYERLLPLAYVVMARDDVRGTKGISADDWYVTERVDDTTLVLFAVASTPRRPDGSARSGPTTAGTEQGSRCSPSG
jgi:SAM-dependent methyltransferase